LSLFSFGWQTPAPVAGTTLRRGLHRDQRPIAQREKLGRMNSVHGQRTVYHAVLTPLAAKPLGHLSHSPLPRRLLRQRLAGRSFKFLYPSQQLLGMLLLFREQGLEKYTVVVTADTRSVPPASA